MKEIRYKQYGRKAKNHIGFGATIGALRLHIIGVSNRRRYTSGNKLWLAKDQHGDEHYVRVCGKKMERVPTHALVPEGLEDTYIVFDGLLGRCQRKGSSNYKSYGAKGVKVHHLWDPNWYSNRGLTSYERYHRAFMRFISDKGVRPPASPRQYCLDRIKPGGNYVPSNTRWIPDYKNIARARRPKLNQKAVYIQAFRAVER